MQNHQKVAEIGMQIGTEQRSTEVHEWNNQMK